MAAIGGTKRWYAARPGLKALIGKRGRSKEFWTEVQSFETKFHLHRDRFGHSIADSGPSAWQPYILHSPTAGLNDELVFVRINQLSWDNIGQAHEDYSQLSIKEVCRFLASVTVAQLPIDAPRVNALTAKEAAQLTEICTETVAIHFSSRHPDSPPHFFVTKPEGGQLNAHTHHWYANGNLCIRSNAAWDRHHSTVQHFGLAIAWLVWHTRKFGPRR